MSAQRVRVAVAVLVPDRRGDHVDFAWPMMGTDRERNQGANDIAITTAARDAANGNSFAAEKVKLPNRLRGSVMCDSPEDIKVTPDMIASGFKVLVDSGVLNPDTDRGPFTGALLPGSSRYPDERLVVDIYRAMIRARPSEAEPQAKAG
jgi:hypothetical protein